LDKHDAALNGGHNALHGLILPLHVHATPAHNRIFVLSTMKELNTQEGQKMEYFLLDFVRPLKQILQ